MALGCQEQRICEMLSSRPPANAVRSPHSRRSETAVPAHAFRIVPRKTRDHLISVSIRRDEHHIRWKRTVHRSAHSISARLEVGGITSSNPALAFPLMLPRASTSSGPESRAAVDRVAIVGGGLGGLAAAIALRNQGIDAQVYEKNAEISGGEGTMISLFPNGLWALSCSHPGLPETLSKFGNVDPTCSNYSPEGKLLGKWELAERMSASYGFPMIAVCWSTVLKALQGLLPADCIHTGHQLMGLEEDESKVSLRFKVGEGEKVVEAPLVVGADGIRSCVRALLFGDIPPHDNGRGIWRAIIPRDSCQHPLILPGHISAVVGEGRTAIISDAGEGRLYWSYTVTDAFRKDPPGGARSVDAEEAKRRLESDFEGWDLALHALQNTEASEILERRVLNLTPMGRWGKGRVQLIGDAAHALTPALGQGANLAFEDGLELARQLASHSSLRDALTAFEATRIPRATCIAKGGEGFAELTRGEEKTAEPPTFYDFMYGYRGENERLQRSDAPQQPWIATPSAVTN